MKVLFIDPANNVLVQILEENDFECLYQPDISEGDIIDTISN